MLIFLVGFMGCGKSTIGRRVAKKLGYEFVDMDREIEQREGRTINEIFASEGEEAFRRMEREFLEGLAPDVNTIVATGGGSPCFGDNMQIMREKGTVMYLKMSPKLLFTRLAHGRAKRPKIANFGDGELLEYIIVSLTEREPFYSRASVVIDCDGVSEVYIVQHIEEVIGLQAADSKEKE